jgi:hypothetical protein
MGSALMRPTGLLSRLGAAMIAVLAAAGPATAETVVDGSAEPLDPALSAAIVALATRDVAEPASARIKGLHLSKARNGRGYCGEMAVSEGADFVPFHVILEADGSGSLLRMPKAGAVEARETAIRLLTNFGCLE